MRRLFCLLLLLIAVKGFSDGEIVITQAGRPMAEIILENTPTRAAQMAAFELRHVIKLITGATLPIVKKSTEGRLPIRIGNAAKGEFKGEQYLVSVSPEEIRLAGHDSEDYGCVDYLDHKTFPGVSYNYYTPKHIYNYHSSLYAVYDFLEILCGVRFYSFGDIGIVFNEQKNLSVKKLERRYEPKTDAFRYAGFVYRDRKGNPLRDQKLLQLRWRMNTLFGEVNHTTDSLIWRYWGPAKGYEKVFIEKRPEYFIRGYEKMPTGDSKSLYTDNNRPPAQFCPSHPDVARYFAQEANDVMNGKAFSDPPLDGVRFRFMKKMDDKPFYYPVQEADNSYWCKCEKCIKLYPEIKGALHHAYMHFDFVNRVSREAKAINPECNISTLAYNMALEYPNPSILRLDPGIAVQMCLGIHSWMHPSIYRRQHGEYKKWIRNEKDKRPLFVWTYILSPEGEAYKSYRYINFFPVQFPWKTAEIFKEFMQDGIRGVFLEVSGHYNLLEGYIAMRTAFDPDYDTNALIDEYFRLYYGKAAEPMKSFFRRNEEITWNSKNYPQREVDNFLSRWRWSSTAMGIHTQSVNWSLGTPERMKILQEYLDDANKKADDPRVKTRLARFMKTIWEPALKGRVAYDKALLLKKKPLPTYTAALYPNETIDWNSVRSASAWTALKTGILLSDKESPQLKIAYTGKSLLIHYVETGDYAFQRQGIDFWDNNVEIFFGQTAAYPFYQVALGVNGVAEAYRHTIQDGVSKLEKENFTGMKFQNHATQEQWSWTLKLPLGELSLQNIQILRMNVIRNYGKTKSAIAWSFLEPVNYAMGIDRMGYVNLPLECPSETLTVNSDFSKADANGMPAGWTQNQPDPKKGEFYTVAKGAVKLNCPFSDVHFMAPTFPVAYGEKVVFEFTASGKGEGGVGLYLYTIYGSKQRWRWHTAQKIPFQAENGGQKRIRIEVDTGKLANRFRDVIGFRPYLMSRKGTEIIFSDLKISREPGMEK